MRELKLPRWKKKKKASFHFYFTIFVSVIICISLASAEGFLEAMRGFLIEKLRIPEIVIFLAWGLVVGGLLSYFVGKFALSPIKKIRNAMNEVSQGNLYVTVEENSRFDEIEDIYHAFNLMTKELRSTEIIQSDFVSNVSHEFKTPLTAIEGYATMLQAEDLSEEERREFTDKILFNAHRMSELVQNNLLLSKLDHQGIAARKEIFSLDEQIRQEILAAETKWTEKEIEFDVKLEPVSYYGNRSLLSHVWSNLLGNAIKFSPDGGTIALELKTEEDCVCFSVADEGEGIEESAKKHIFDKFYQSDTSHKQEGNGLGLALVKKITDIYGGEADVRNLTKGCVFTVRLPVSYVEEE